MATLIYCQGGFCYYDDGSFQDYEGRDCYYTTEVTWVEPTPDIPGTPPTVDIEYHLGWFNATAISVNVEPDDFELSCDAPDVIGVVMGVTDDFTDNDYRNIEHGLYFANGQVQAVELGFPIGPMVDLVSGSKVSLMRYGTRILYINNGVQFYESLIPSSGPKFAAISLYSGGDSVSCSEFKDAIFGTATGDQDTVGVLDGARSIIGEQAQDFVNVPNGITGEQETVGSLMAGRTILGLQSAVGVLPGTPWPSNVVSSKELVVYGGETVADGNISFRELTVETVGDVLVPNFGAGYIVMAPMLVGGAGQSQSPGIGDFSFRGLTMLGSDYDYASGEIGFPPLMMRGSSPAEFNRMYAECPPFTIDATGFEAEKNSMVAAAPAFTLTATAGSTIHESYNDFELNGVITADGVGNGLMQVTVT